VPEGCAALERVSRAPTALARRGLHNPPLYMALRLASVPQRTLASPRCAAAVPSKAHQLNSTHCGGAMGARSFSRVSHTPSAFVSTR
jgi:hypothetical protein